MTKPLLAISNASLRQAPFFVLEGPDARPLACQWTAFSNGYAHGTEFEILCPETPEAMGCLFGLFEGGEFRMRPAVCINGNRATLAPELDLDLSWRGDLNNVLDTGFDWDMSSDGLLVIADPEHVAESDHRDCATPCVA